MIPPDNRIPATIITGFLGSGKVRTLNPVFDANEPSIDSFLYGARALLLGAVQCPPSIDAHGLTVMRFDVCKN